MQTIKQRQQLAHWRNRDWRYQPASSHGDSSSFRQRQEERAIREARNGFTLKRIEPK